MARSTADAQSLPPLTRALAEASYWISPKPIDAGLMLFNALEAEKHFERPEVFKLLEAGDGFSPALSILSSLLITAGFLALAAYELDAKDY
jgi:hypothetical protein